MNFFAKKIFLVVLFLVFQLSVCAQKQVKLEQADYLESGEADGERFNKLVGAVIFSQKTTKIYCDSAYLYKERNAVKAFGNVKIEDGDSIDVTARRLEYDGDKKFAILREEVVYSGDSVFLYTDSLDYDIAHKFAKYFGGGKLVDTVNELSSKEAIYYTEPKVAYFKDSVILTNPEYTLESDTLIYDTNTKIATVKGPTKIVSEDSTTLYANEGEFNTTEKQSTFGKGSKIETEAYILSGDELFFDDINKFYAANKNVELIAVEDQVIITGQYGRYWKSKGITKVYDDALLKKILSDDTLFLSADTLVSIEDSLDARKRVLGYHDVRIYKKYLQGKCDSVAYHFADSIIYFYRDPILWNVKNQIEADSINIELADNKIDKMNMAVNSFVISQDTLTNFNQIKGRRMTAFFKDNKLDKVNVDGNGESIYFALEGDSVLIGMNKIICSNMAIRFEENELNNMTFYANPDAAFIPPHEILAPEMKLNGFAWREEEKPSREDVIMRTPEPMQQEKGALEEQSDQSEGQ